MKRSAILVIILIGCVVIRPVLAKPIHHQLQETGPDPGRAFELILDLWREGRFSELYDRIIPSGKQSRESFISRLSSSYRKPACCWEKLQDLKITELDERKATLHARVGLEGKDGSTEFISRQFKLHKSAGVWKVSISEITSLSGKTRKGAHKRNYTLKKKVVQSFYRVRQTSRHFFPGGMRQTEYAFNFLNRGAVRKDDHFYHCGNG